VTDNAYVQKLVRQLECTRHHWHWLLANDWQDGMSSALPASSTVTGFKQPSLIMMKIGCLTPDASHASHDRVRALRSNNPVKHW
jgi:hypothetical protein